MHERIPSKLASSGRLLELAHVIESSHEADAHDPPTGASESFESSSPSLPTPSLRANTRRRMRMRAGSLGGPDLSKACQTYVRRTTIIEIVPN